MSASRLSVIGQKTVGGGYDVGSEGQHLCERRTAAWSGPIDDSQASRGTLSDKVRRHTDRVFWAKALPEDKAGRKFFKPNPL